MQMGLAVVGLGRIGALRALPECRRSSSKNFIRAVFGADVANPATAPDALHCEPANGSMLET